MLGVYPGVRRLLNDIRSENATVRGGAYFRHDGTRIGYLTPTKIHISSCFSDILLKHASTFLQPGDGDSYRLTVDWSNAYTFTAFTLGRFTAASLNKLAVSASQSKVYPSPNYDCTTQHI